MKAKIKLLEVNTKYDLMSIPTQTVSKLVLNSEVNLKSYIQTYSTGHKITSIIFENDLWETTLYFETEEFLWAFVYNMDLIKEEKDNE